MPINKLLEREYDNERKSQFLWFSEITPSSEIHKLLKNCSTDEMMHFFDMGFRYAMLKIQNSVNELDNSNCFNNYHELKENLKNDIRQRVEASFTLNINSHTDHTNSKIRKRDFHQTYKQFD
jgi:hypothetical protein